MAKSKTVFRKDLSTLKTTHCGKNQSEQPTKLEPTGVNRIKFRLTTWAYQLFRL